MRRSPSGTLYRFGRTTQPDRARRAAPASRRMTLRYALHPKQEYVPIIDRKLGRIAPRMARESWTPVIIGTHSSVELSTPSEYSSERTLPILAERRSAFGTEVVGSVAVSRAE
jgi:hypothetical protein